MSATDIIDNIITEAEPITSVKIDKIIMAFKKGAAAKPEEFHHLECKIYQKYIQDIADGNYQLNEIMEVGKKVLSLRRISFPRSY